MSKTQHTIKIIWNIITDIAVVLLVVLAIFLAGVRLFGLTPYKVTSGSMRPTYQVGSLVYVKKVNPNKLDVGDPITYMLTEDTIVTHRIVKVIPDETEPGVIRFITKGDANQSEDPAVHCNNVIGKVVFSVPQLGYLSAYLETQKGKYVAVGVCALLLLLTILPSLIFPNTSKKVKKELVASNSDKSNECEKTLAENFETDGKYKEND